MAVPFIFSVPSGLSWYEDLALLGIILTKIHIFLTFLSSLLCTTMDY